MQKLLIAAFVMVFSLNAGGDVLSVSTTGAIKTLTQARDAARGMKKPVSIKFANGTYMFAEPVVFDHRDSGVTIEAAPNEKPIFSGGRRIAGWKKDSLNGHECWSAAVGAKQTFHELWIDGKRALRARHPNTGYFKVKESPDATDNWETGQSRFRFNDNDIPAGPFNEGAELIVGTRWVESRLPIKSVDADQKLISFSRKSQWRTEPNDPFWLEGDARWLDQPGEWFLDSAKGVVYYQPLPGQAIDKIEAVVPVLIHLIELRGDVAKNAPINDLTFRGITFSHTEWMLPAVDPATTQPASGGFTQAAIPVPAAVQAKDVRRVKFENCTFEHMGTWGLELGASTQQGVIAFCTFRDLGAGGIRLGGGGISQKIEEQSFQNHIIDTDIGDVGHVFPSAVGIWVGQVFDNVIAHNHIHDLYYSGISIGWTWGYETSLNRGNVIEQNHIHHVGSPSHGKGPMLADMGAIYTLGAREGSIIRNNLIHNVEGIRIAWGIYLDEGSSSTLVENNVVHHSSHGGFHQHYGKENIIRNNIFAMSRIDQQIQRTREEPHRSLSFERNIVYWTGTPFIMTPPTGMKFDRNLYGIIGETKFTANGLTWAQWQAAGQDRNSLLADPLFGDPEHGDFTLKPGSPAEKIGFEPIDVSHVGPRTK